MIVLKNHICVFSGWMREFYGPSLLGVFAPQLLSRSVWVLSHVELNPFLTISTLCRRLYMNLLWFADGLSSYQLAQFTLSLTNLSWLCMLVWRYDDDHYIITIQRTRCNVLNSCLFWFIWLMKLVWCHQDAQPRVVMALRNPHLKEPEEMHPNTSVTIVDNDNKSNIPAC